MSKHNVIHATFNIERKVKASPAKVFSMFATLEMKQRWFGGPPEWNGKTTLDFRVGGIETSTGGPPGGTVHKYVARYTNIVKDERIIYAYDMWMDDEHVSTSVASFQFHADGAGTRLQMTEHGIYLDGADKPAMREEGSNALMDMLVRAAEK